MLITLSFYVLSWLMEMPLCHVKHLHKFKSTEPMNIFYKGMCKSLLETKKIEENAG